MKQRMSQIRHIKQGIFDNIFENGSYKLVALFIALILWLTILGRREFVVIKEVEVDFTVAKDLKLASQSSDKVKVKMTGPQSSLQKFKEASQTLQINLAEKTVGEFDIEVTASYLNTPAGIKILSVKPSQIRVEISAIKD